jgi:hypothetical protein
MAPSVLGEHLYGMAHWSLYLFGKKSIGETAIANHCCVARRGHKV